MARGGSKRKANAPAVADGYGSTPALDRAREEAASKAAKVAGCGEKEKEKREAAAKEKREAAATERGAFQAPEAAEVLEIAQTRNLFKSNLFRLQLEELLREVAPTASRPRLEAFLRTLQPALMALKPREMQADLAGEFPHLHFHQRQPFPFSFAAPQRVDIVGSFLLGTVCKGPRLNVDLALEMPSAAFQSKDHLNFRYTDKRAAYVGEVYKQLLRAVKAGGDASPMAGMELHFEALQGDAFRPCVVVRPGGKLEAREGPWVVRLLPACAPDLWTASKLAADRNAVRPLTAAGSDAAATASSTPPSPHYNSCVLEDSRMRSHLEFLHNALQKVPALKDAILLLKQWAAAKGYSPDRSGVTVFVPLNGFCISILAAHAAQTAGVSASQTSSFQLFKLALNVLASTEWGSQKVTLGSAASGALTAQEQGACGAHFYDTDGIFNFFWRLGPFIAEIRQQAQRDLKVLDATSDPYEAVFGKCSTPELTWDLIVRLPGLGAAALCPDIAANFAEPDAVGKPRAADAPEAMALGANLATALAMGLGDRCVRTATRIVGDACLGWTNKKPAQGATALVGVFLDASFLDRVLDRGPSAQEASATQFKKFWGADKAEMRRFKDGSILECVVWAKPPIDRRVESKKQPAVVTQIVKHVLTRHFKQVAAEADILAGPLGFLPNLRDHGRHLWQAYEEFRKHLTELKSLPLTIKDVHAGGTDFTYTEVSQCPAPPAADGILRTLHPVIVEFESSGRWPSNPGAAQKVCTALLLQMKQELQTDLGIESDVTEHFLDVRYPEFVFRIQVFHQHELTAVAHRVTNFQVQPGGEAPDSAALERLRTLWWRPRLIANLHSQVLQRPALAGAVRLCKRWMASQMLSGYDEFIEHLTASVFLQPAPFEAPTSPQVGFCRVCWLLDTFDWSHEPLIIDFDGKLTEEERLAMRSSFENSHESMGANSFWISSRFDPHATLLVTPPSTVSAWLKKRARQALDVFGKRLLGLGSAAERKNDWQQLFAIDTSIFDIIIRLQPPGDGDSSAAQKKGGVALARRRSMAVREAAAGFVEKLRLNLSSVCMVFHDKETHMVGLKWRPDAFFPQHQNVLMGSVPHTMLSQGKDAQPLCIPNVLCLTSFISSLAEGLAVEIRMVGAEL